MMGNSNIESEFEYLYLDSPATTTDKALSLCLYECWYVNRAKCSIRQSLVFDNIQ